MLQKRFLPLPVFKGGGREASAPISDVMCLHISSQVCTTVRMYTQVEWCMAHFQGSLHLFFSVIQKYGKHKLASAIFGSSLSIWRKRYGRLQSGRRSRPFAKLGGKPRLSLSSAADCQKTSSGHKRKAKRTKKKSPFKPGRGSHYDSNDSWLLSFPFSLFSSSFMISPHVLTAKETEMFFSMQSTLDIKWCM